MNSCTVLSNIIYALLWAIFFPFSLSSMQNPLDPKKETQKAIATLASDAKKLGENEILSTQELELLKLRAESFISMEKLTSELRVQVNQLDQNVALKKASDCPSLKFRYIIAQEAHLEALAWLLFFLDSHRNKKNHINQILQTIYKKNNLFDLYEKESSQFSGDDFRDMKTYINRLKSLKKPEQRKLIDAILTQNTIKFLSILQSKTVDLNTLNGLGYLPIIYAVVVNRPDYVLLLHASGADTNIRVFSRKERPMVPLLLVSPEMHEMEKVLKQCNSDINFREENKLLLTEAKKYAFCTGDFLVFDALLQRSDILKSHFDEAEKTEVTFVSTIKLDKREIKKRFKRINKLFKKARERYEKQSTEKLQDNKNEKDSTDKKPLAPAIQKIEITSSSPVVVTSAKTAEKAAEKINSVDTKKLLENFALNEADIEDLERRAKACMQAISLSNNLEDQIKKLDVQIKNKHEVDSPSLRMRSQVAKEVLTESLMRLFQFFNSRGFTPEMIFDQNIRNELLSFLAPKISHTFSFKVLTYDISQIPDITKSIIKNQVNAIQISRNPQSRTLIDCILMDDEKTTSEILRNETAHINEPDTALFAPLFYAVLFNRNTIARQLLQAKAAANIMINSEFTQRALHSLLLIAPENKHMDELLKSYGADLNLVDLDGVSILSEAIDHAVNCGDFLMVDVICARNDLLVNFLNVIKEKGMGIQKINNAMQMSTCIERFNKIRTILEATITRLKKRDEIIKKLDNSKNQKKDKEKEEKSRAEKNGQQKDKDVISDEKLQKILASFHLADADLEDLESRSQAVHNIYNRCLEVKDLIKKNESESVGCARLKLLLYHLEEMYADCLMSIFRFFYHRNITPQMLFDENLRSKIVVQLEKMRGKSCTHTILSRGFSHVHPHIKDLINQDVDIIRVSRKPKSQELVQAIFEGSYKKVAQILQSHDSALDEIDATVALPLFCAIAMNRIDMVEILLDVPANPNIWTDRGACPLLLVQPGNQEMERELKRTMNGADVNMLHEGDSLLAYNKNYAYKTGDSLALDAVLERDDISLEHVNNAINKPFNKIPAENEEHANTLIRRETYIVNSLANACLSSKLKLAAHQAQKDKVSVIPLNVAIKSIKAMRNDPRVQLKSMPKKSFLSDGKLIRLLKKSALKDDEFEELEIVSHAIFNLHDRYIKIEALANKSTVRVGSLKLQSIYLREYFCEACILFFLFFHERGIPAKALFNESVRLNICSHYLKNRKKGFTYDLFQKFSKIMCVNENSIDKNEFNDFKQNINKQISLLNCLIFGGYHKKMDELVKSDKTLVSKKTELFNMPLFSAVLMNDIEAARIILAAGGSANVVTRDGVFPLLLVEPQAQEMNALLLQYKADINDLITDTDSIVDMTKNYAYQTGEFAAFDALIERDDIDINHVINAQERKSEPINGKDVENATQLILRTKYIDNALALARNRLEIAQKKKMLDQILAKEKNNDETQTNCMPSIAVKADGTSVAIGFLNPETLMIKSVENLNKNIPDNKNDWNIKQFKPSAQKIDELENLRKVNNEMVAFVKKEETFVKKETLKVKVAKIMGVRLNVRSCMFLHQMGVPIDSLFVHETYKKLFNFDFKPKTRIFLTVYASISPLELDRDMLLCMMQQPEPLLQLIDAILECDYGKMEILLKDEKVNPNQFDDQAFAPIYYAVVFDNVEAVKILHRYKADLNLMNEYGIVPLALAPGHKSKVAQFLRENSVDPNTLSVQNKSAIRTALEKPCSITELIIEALLRINVRFNETDIELVRSLHDQAHISSNECLKKAFQNILNLFANMSILHANITPDQIKKSPMASQITEQLLSFAIARCSAEKNINSLNQYVKQKDKEIRDLNAISKDIGSAIKNKKIEERKKQSEQRKQKELEIVARREKLEQEHKEREQKKQDELRIKEQEEKEANEQKIKEELVNEAKKREEAATLERELKLKEQEKKNLERLRNESQTVETQRRISRWELNTPNLAKYVTAGFVPLRTNNKVSLHDDDNKETEEIRTCAKLNKPTSSKSGSSNSILKTVKSVSIYETHLKEKAAIDAKIKEARAKEMEMAAQAQAKLLLEKKEAEEKRIRESADAKAMADRAEQQRREVERHQAHEAEEKRRIERQNKEREAQQLLDRHKNFYPYLLDPSYFYVVSEPNLIKYLESHQKFAATGQCPVCNQGKLNRSVSAMAGRRQKQEDLVMDYMESWHRKHPSSLDKMLADSIRLVQINKNLSLTSHT